MIDGCRRPRFKMRRVTKRRQSETAQIATPQNKYGQLILVLLGREQTLINIHKERGQ